MNKIINKHVKTIKALLSPHELQQQLPITDEITAHVLASRQAIVDCIEGKDERLLVIVGPCSVHDVDAAIEYAQRLKPLADQLSDRLQIVMRVYFEKPRTSVGWKGLINDPHLDGSCDIATGFTTARELLLTINQLGLPVASEFVDLITPQYVGDLISWAAIGARTTESQIHRTLASGLSVPVGFKNATSGNIDVAVNAVIAASHSHSFLSVTETGQVAIVETSGNPDCHLVLRGGDDGPNFDHQSLVAAQEALRAKGLLPAVMVDASHANSAKDYRRQVAVVESLMTSMKTDPDLLMGVMIESNLVAGSQSLDAAEALTYGKSITDGCLGWSETETLLKRLADKVGG